MLLALTLTDGIGIATGTVAALTLILTYVLIRHGITQVLALRRLIEAGVAAEVRSRNTACRRERQRVVQAFPLHVDFLTPTLPDGWGMVTGVEGWEVSADGDLLLREEAQSIIACLRGEAHPAFRTWENLGDLSDTEFDEAVVVVGFLNDLCQMLSDGTPGHFIFQQYHQLILTLGPLTMPLVQRQQLAGRWGVRLPSLINRAAIYHRVRSIHAKTTVKIRRPLDLADAASLSPALDGKRRVELLIPVVGPDGTTGSVFYHDIRGREMDPPVDYDAFAAHYAGWRPPKVFH